MYTHFYPATRYWNCDFWGSELPKILILLVFFRGRIHTERWGWRNLEVQICCKSAWRKCQQNSADFTHIRFNTSSLLFTYLLLTLMLVLIKYLLDDELTQHVLNAAPPVWHGPVPEHHWQCSRQVAWSSSSTSAETGGHWAIVVTVSISVNLFSHVTRNVSFLSNIIRFLSCICCNLQQMWFFNSRGIVH